MYWYTVGYPVGASILCNILNFKLGIKCTILKLRAGIFCTIPWHVLVYSEPKIWERAAQDSGPLGRCRALAVTAVPDLGLARYLKFKY